MSFLTQQQIEAVEQLLAPARAYCEYIERIPDEPPRSLFADLCALLVALVGPAHALPVVEMTWEVDLSLPGPESRGIDLMKRMDRLTVDGVSLLYDPGDEWDEGGLMLFDDLADLSHDLSEACRLWDIGADTARAEAALQLRCGYDIHWGTHLHRALWTVRRVCWRIASSDYGE